MKINLRKHRQIQLLGLKIINKYMETMKHAGYQNVKVYSYRQLLQTRLNHPNILQHVNWVAAYTDALDWNNPHYSGEKGWTIYFI